MLGRLGAGVWEEKDRYGKGDVEQELEYWSYGKIRRLRRMASRREKRYICRSSFDGESDLERISGMEGYI